VSQRLCHKTSSTTTYSVSEIRRGTRSNWVYSPNFRLTGPADPVVRHFDSGKISGMPPFCGKSCHPLWRNDLRRLGDSPLWRNDLRRYSRSHANGSAILRHPG
jgi:hypothetical protein